MAGSKAVERWGAHVGRAQRQGKSLWRYARDNGIGYESLRRVRVGLEAVDARSVGQGVDGGAVVTGADPSDAFTRVQVRQGRGAVQSALDRVQVHFPHGVVVEFDSHGPVTARITSIITTLGGLHAAL